MYTRPALTKDRASAAAGDPNGRYELRDGKIIGLRLIVQPSGSKSWGLRYTKDGRDRKLILGDFRTIGLDDARKLASAAKRDVVLGADPAAAKAEARRVAAAGIAADDLFVTNWARYCAAPKPKARNKAQWRKASREQAERFFKNRLEPRWGKRRLSEIQKRDVIALMDDIAARHPHAASRGLAVLTSFFNWCVARDLVAKSPCDDVEPAAKPNKRKRKLTDAEIRWLWKACDEEPFPMGQICRLLLLTLARRTEVSGMRYAELHLGNQRQWIVPAARAKNNVEHQIHLTESMLAIIKKIPRIRSKAGYVFTTNGETSFTGYSKAKLRLEAAMLRIAKDEDPEVESIPNWTLHDLRRTGSTRMQRLGFEKEIVDAVTNHVTDDSYQQHDYEPEKVRAFEAWSREVERIVAGTSANVVPMRRAGGN